MPSNMTSGVKEAHRLAGDCDDLGHYGASPGHDRHHASAMAPIILVPPGCGEDPACEDLEVTMTNAVGVLPAARAAAPGG